ncbi:MAG: hypothetical protein L3K25_15615 [Gammaproteobacteria bacterium]|nr:hypothetical protein [Gammaproteobacteria bacterium]
MSGKNHNDNQQAVATAGRQILEQILADYRGSVAVQIRNEERVVEQTDAPCAVVFNRL